MDGEDYTPSPVSRRLRAIASIAVVGLSGCVVAHRSTARLGDAATPLGDANAAETLRADSGLPVDDAVIGADVQFGVDVTAVDVPAVLPDVLPADVFVAPDVMANFQVMTADNNTTDWNGGWTFDGRSVDCGNDEVMVGVTGNASDYVNALGLRCAHLHRDGTLTGEHVVNQSGGSSGTDFDDHCPDSQIVVADQGRSGGVVDQFAGICAELGPWLATQTVGATLPARGGTGGSAFGTSCPSGYVGHGFDFNIGSYNWHDRVYRVRLKCVRVTNVP